MPQALFAFGAFLFVLTAFCMSCGKLSRLGNETLLSRLKMSYLIIFLNVVNKFVYMVYFVYLCSVGGI